MINNTYARAYTEVLEILKHFPEKEYKKIPVEKINFYKNHMDKNYQFTINPKMDLANQNISKEANAIIVSLYRDYFATKEQKVKIKEILDLNQKKEEIEKRKNYTPDDIFKNNRQANTVQANTVSENSKNSDTTNQLVKYKENFFIRFKKFIFKFLHLEG